MSDENLRKANSVILDWYDDDFEHKFPTQGAKVPIQTEQYTVHYIGFFLREPKNL